MSASRFLPVVCACLLLLFAAGGGQAAERDLGPVVDALVEQGDSLVGAYVPETGMDTSDGFSDLYFDVFEGRGLESAIGLRDGDLKGALESRFSRLISLTAEGAAATAVTGEWGALRGELLALRADYAGAAADGWLASALQSFLILLREGVEALLVVGALIAYVQRAGAARALRAIYVGIGVALVASLATAGAVRASVMGLDGRTLEAVEGVTMLAAAAVLLYVGHWLMSKRDAERWQAYVKGKVDRAVQTDNGWALAFAAFLAVYREGAETVLFYQALLADSGAGTGPVAAGFVAAAVVLAGLFAAVRLLGLRMPLKPFFTVTAVLLVTLAFLFAGKGVVELQVIRWVSATPLPGVPQLPWLGLHPTVESVAAQAAVLAAIALGAVVPSLRLRKVRP